MRALSHHFGLEVVLGPQIKCFSVIFSIPSYSVIVWKKHSDFLTSGLFKYEIGNEDEDIYVLLLSLPSPASVCVTITVTLLTPVIH